MNPAELESLVHHALRRLPPLRAPQTLVPRVLSAIRTPTPSAWYRRPWISWPGALRAVSVVGIAALVSLAWVVLEAANGSGVWSAMGETVATLSGFTDDAMALLAAMRVLWRVFLEPTVGYLVTLVAVMGLAVGLFCAALARVLWEGSAST